MKVSKETAKFFMDQCVGTYSGHMAAIPNNPVLYGLLKCHGIDQHSTHQMAEFLCAVAYELKEELPF